MTRKFFVSAGLLGLCLGGDGTVSLHVFAQTTESSAKQTAPSQKGLHFGVPEDWPIEKRGGVLAPVPVEEYVLNRFRNVASQIDVTKNELQGLIQGLRADLEDFKKSVHQRLGEIQQEMEFVKSANRPAEAASLPEVSPSPPEAERIGNLERRLETIHKDLTGKLDGLQSSLDGIEQKRLRSLQFNLDVLDEKVKLLIEEFEDIR